MKNRVICFFVVFMLLILPVYAEYIGGLCGTKAMWSISEDYEVLTISGKGDVTSCDWNEKYNESIKEVIIDEGITSIPTLAFGDCTKLESITIPSTLAEMYSAFNEDFLIKEVNISDLSAWCSIDFAKSISNPLLYGAKLYINGSFSEDLRIPDRTSKIKAFTFYNYKYLKTIIIPERVTTIGACAFSGCSGLEKVYYMGSRRDWNRIVVEANNEPLINANIVFLREDETTGQGGSFGGGSPIEIVNALSTENSLKFVSKAGTGEDIDVSAFGTTFIPLWLFEQESKDIVTVEYDNADYDIQNGQTFGATLKNIPNNYKDIDIVGKSFIKDANGEYIWSSAKYASINDTSLKSIE